MIRPVLGRRSVAHRDRRAEKRAADREISKGRSAIKTAVSPLRRPKILAVLVVGLVVGSPSLLSSANAATERPRAVRVKAPTPYLRFIEHACDVHRDNLGPELAFLAGDFTGYIYREPATGRKYRPATSFVLGYENRLGDYNECHVIARGRKILHGPHFRFDVSREA